MSKMKRTIAFVLAAWILGVGLASYVSPAEAYPPDPVFHP